MLQPRSSRSQPCTGSGSAVKGRAGLEHRTIKSAPICLVNPCSRARSSKSRCRCWCNGRFHGVTQRDTTDGKCSVVGCTVRTKFAFLLYGLYWLRFCSWHAEVIGHAQRG